MKHVVMFSGGIGSWAAAKLVAKKYGTEDLYLLFTDVKGDAESPHIGEDEDTYRFLDDAVRSLRIKDSLETLDWLTVHIH